MGARRTQLAVAEGLCIIGFDSESKSEIVGNSKLENQNSFTARLDTASSHILCKNRNLFSVIESGDPTHRIGGVGPNPVIGWGGSLHENDIISDCQAVYCPSLPVEIIVSEDALTKSGWVIHLATGERSMTRSKWGQTKQIYKDKFRILCFDIVFNSGSCYSSCSMLNLRPQTHNDSDILSFWSKESDENGLEALAEYKYLGENPARIGICQGCGGVFSSFEGESNFESGVNTVAMICVSKSRDDKENQIQNVNGAVENVNFEELL